MATTTTATTATTIIKSTSQSAAAARSSATTTTTTRSSLAGGVLVLVEMAMMMMMMMMMTMFWSGSPTTHAWQPAAFTRLVVVPSSRRHVALGTIPTFSSASTCCWSSSSSNNNNSNSNTPDDGTPAEEATAAATTTTPTPPATTISSAWVTSFDEAGRSLIEEEDQQRLAQMGDFDSNPAYQSDRMEQMRAAVRARTADLGLEKSKISQQLIQQAQARAMASSPSASAMPPPPQQQLDLSQITTSSSFDSNSNNKFNREDLPEGLPSMLYDPEQDMTDQEKLEADPDGQLDLVQQGLNEISRAKWPSWTAALREVILLLTVVALSAVLIVGWDKFLRGLYTSWGWIPSMDDIAVLNNNQNSPMLMLPDGWTNNMNDQDIMQLQEQLSTTTTIPPPPPPTTTTTTTTLTLPEL